MAVQSRRQKAASVYGKKLMNDAYREKLRRDWVKKREAALDAQARLRKYDDTHIDPDAEPLMRVLRGEVKLKPDRKSTTKRRK